MVGAILMKAKINLHTHERENSYDSSTPARVMSSVYTALGYDAVGFVGHDEMANVESGQLIIFNGIERTISEDPEIHIVEYPEIGFSFLAHPGRTRKDISLAKRLISEHSVDGIEKFSNGVKQYEGHIDGVIELANDDAHNVFQIGTSFMEIDVKEINRGQIVQAIKRGDITLRNNRRRFIGQGVKAVNGGVGIALGRKNSSNA